MGLDISNSILPEVFRQNLVISLYSLALLSSSFERMGRCQVHVLAACSKPSR